MAEPVSLEELLALYADEQYLGVGGVCAQFVLRLKAVADQHQPMGIVTPFCKECGEDWPCKTDRTLNGEKAQEGEADA